MKTSYDSCIVSEPAQTPCGQVVAFRLIEAVRVIEQTHLRRSVFVLQNVRAAESLFTALLLHPDRLLALHRRLLRLRDQDVAVEPL